MGRRILSVLCGVLLAAALPAQTGTEDGAGIPDGGAPVVNPITMDPVLLIGLSLDTVLSRYGPPQSVYAVRGLEEWQDDVVFVYTDWDLYIFRDRVWQVSVKSAYGISLGDPQGIAPLVLGEEVRSFDGYLLYSLPPRSWPLQMRMNLDLQGRVSAIYIYRSDF